MKKGFSFVGVTCAALAATLIVPAPALSAEESSFPGTFSGNVAITSEYYFRGLSQTDDAPALQGGLDYELSLAKPVALYVGAWGSNVDFNEGGGVDGATIEIDLYGGLRGAIGDTGLTWDIGGIYYTYPGAASGLNYDFVEVQGALGYDFGFAAVTGSVNYSPENFGKSGDATYTKLALDVPVPGIKGLSVAGYVAHQDIEKEAVFGTADYNEWNASITYNVLGFDLSVAYSDTDVSPSADGNEEAVLFTIARSF